MRHICLLAASFFFLPVTAAANSDLIQVTGVRFWSFPDVTRVVLETTGPVAFKADRARDPERVFFDILSATPFIAHKRLYTQAVSDRLVKRIRIAETAPGTTRVVFDLSEPARFDVTRLDTPDRMVIELRPLGAPPAAGTTAVASQTPVVIAPPGAHASPGTLASPTIVATGHLVRARKAARIFALPPAVPARRPQIAIPPSPPQIAFTPPDLPPAFLIDPMSVPNDPLKRPPAAATEPVVVSSTRVLPAPPRTGAPKTTALAGENAAKSLTRALGLKVGRVVIDAGHGGHDNGTIGPHGVLEKDVVLDVALRLSKLVQERMGAEVVLTRSEDNFVPLHERTAIANNLKADLFLSIHANSSPAREVAGTETFYLNFTSSPGAIDVAARENAGSEKNVGDLRDLIQSITLNDKIEESQTFASSIQTAMQAQAARSNPTAQNRGVKRAPFVVLIGASMPSVLAEIGFLSNPKDEANLGKPEYRQKVAEALYKGLSQYAQSLSHFETPKQIARSERGSAAANGVQH